MTSHDVVAKSRRELNTRKIGHAGTLDPMATGVLVLGIGDGTRLLQYITAGVKAYDATVKLGQLTSTDDKEGEVIANTEIPADIPGAFAKQVGKIMQRPSSVSAIRIDGKRAYDLVREGKEVDIPPREVEVFDIKINEIRVDEVDISVTCSAGTYIRAIARDLGVALGVGGHLTRLRRTHSSGFTLDDARSLDDTGLAPIPLRQALARFLTEIVVTRDEGPKVLNGLSLPWRWPDRAEPVMVIAEGGETLLAIGQQSEGRLTYFSVFNHTLAD